MPIGAQDHLDKLYAKQRMLTDEATRLESVRDRLDPDGPDADQHYILEIQIAALRQSRAGSPRAFQTFLRGTYSVERAAFSVR